MRPNRMLASVAAAVVLSTSVGWVAGARMKSPAQLAAETDAPEASLITVAAEQRQLESVVTTRGTVRFGKPRNVNLAASSLGGGQTGGLVTKPPVKGTVLDERSVAMEIAGRPVQVLRGQVPMYRDIGPGDEGDDVRQLEEALQRMGFQPGKVDGVYDVATEGAVDRWYTAAGYRPSGATDEQLDQLRTARDAASQAEDDLLRAQRELEAARDGASAKEIAQAEADVRERTRAVDRAKEAVAVADAAAEAARRAADRSAANQEKVTLDAELSIRRANADVTNAEHRAEEAAQSLDIAKRKLDHDLNTYTEDDPNTPANESRRVASDVQIEQDRDDIERAENNLEEATTAVDTARRSKDAALLAARDSLTQADVAAAQATQSALQAANSAKDALRSVDAAKDAAALAQLALAVLRDPPDLRSATAQLAKAKRDRASAAERLADLDGRIGVVVPANELLFFSDLPLRVDEAKVERGDTVTAAVMVVTTSRLAVDGSLSLADAKLVAVGDEVGIRAPDLGVEVTGRISRVADTPGTDGVDAQRIYVEITMDSAPPELTGASVALSIAVASTEGKVLAVPVAAVSVSSDGTSRVQVEDDDGTTRFVTVDAGLAAAGLVEVRPVKGRLRAGDRVVVGATR